jgi:hypothetical protein
LLLASLTACYLEVLLVVGYNSSKSLAGIKPPADLTTYLTLHLLSSTLQNHSKIIQSTTPLPASFKSQKTLIKSSSQHEQYSDCSCRSIFTLTFRKASQEFLFTFFPFHSSLAHVFAINCAVKRTLIYESRLMHQREP